MQKLPEGYILIKETEYRALLERIATLEAHLNQNSSNSSKPPSSDGYSKTVKNNREKSDRKPGAQPGHPGSGLSLFTAVDKEVKCAVAGRCACGADLEKQPSVNTEKRQVIDLPERLFEVVEYLVEVKQCRCGKIHKGQLEYEQRVQYGKRLKALLVYMNVQQQLPYDRLQEFTGDIIGVRVSDGLIQSCTEECSRHLDKPAEQIKKGLLESAVAHADETGVRCAGKTNWLHNLSNAFYTFYFFHAGRGKAAMDAMGLLPRYKGTLVHDRWASYDQYDCEHALCNAHLLRDLKFVHEEMNRTWAKELQDILRQANERKNAETITKHYQTRTKNRIEELVNRALRNEPQQQQKTGKRGKKRKGKALCLLEAFRDRLDEILMFLYRKEVPFDNNLAERDLRMMKLKQKISGCFRSVKGIETFCKIRSYISTVKKQNQNVWQAIALAIQGNPMDLSVCSEQ